MGHNSDDKLLCLKSFVQTLSTFLFKSYREKASVKSKREIIIGNKLSDLFHQMLDSATYPNKPEF